jgi:tetratricopeptide (TPR) repeat protein
VESVVVANRDIDPAVQAQLRRTLGNVYQARSQYGQARRHLEAALDQSRRLHGEMHTSTSAALHDLARLTISTGPPDAALKLIQQSLDLHRALHGEKHESVAQNMQDLSEVIEAVAEKRELLEKALAIRRSLTSTPTQGIASNLNALGVAAYHSGDLARARTYFEESLTIIQRVLPPGHPFSFTVMNNLAICYQRFGQFDEAERLYRTLIAERRRIVGEESHGAGTAFGNLGTLLTRQGKHSEAEDAFRKALAILEKSLGPAHREVANARRNLGMIRVLRRDPQSGMVMLRQAAESLRKSHGELPAYWYMLGQEAVAKANTGRAAEAERQLRTVVGELAKVTGASQINDSRVQLGFVLLQTGNPAEAEDVFRQALAARNQRSPVDEESVAEAESGLGAALDRQGKPEGRELLRRSLLKFRAWGLANPYFITLASQSRSLR